MIARDDREKVRIVELIKCKQYKNKHTGKRRQINTQTVIGMGNSQGFTSIGDCDGDELSEKLSLGSFRGAAGI